MKNNLAQKRHLTTEDDRGILFLIKKSRQGLKYSSFQKIEKEIPLKISEWSAILHLSERTLQRYKKENLSFSPIYSEKILEIQILFNKGMDVFGKKDKFLKWLYAQNIALGGVQPVSLLDSTFGILFIKDELSRIENGILA